MSRRKKKTKIIIDESKKIQINLLDGIIFNFLHFAYNSNTFFSLEKTLNETGKLSITMPTNSFSNYDFVTIELKMEKNRK